MIWCLETVAVGLRQRNRRVVVSLLVCRLGGLLRDKVDVNDSVEGFEEIFRCGYGFWFGSFEEGKMVGLRVRTLEVETFGETGCSVDFLGCCLVSRLPDTAEVMHISMY